MTKSIYPFASIKCWQTIQINGESQKVADAAYQHGRKYGKKFKTRTLPNGKIEVQRIRRRAAA